MSFLTIGEQKAFQHILEAGFRVAVTSVGEPSYRISHPRAINRELLVEQGVPTLEEVQRMMFPIGIRS